MCLRTRSSTMPTKASGPNCGSSGGWLLPTCRRYTPPVVCCNRLAAATHPSAKRWQLTAYVSQLAAADMPAVHATGRLLQPPCCRHTPVCQALATDRTRLSAAAAAPVNYRESSTCLPNVHEIADRPPPPQQWSADVGAAALLHRRVTAALDHHICCVKHLWGRRIRPGGRVVWWQCGDV